MTPRSLRLVRAGLLGSLLIVGLSIALTLRRPRGESEPLGAASPGPAGAPVTEGVVFRSLKGDVERFLLKAKAMVGKEQEELRLRSVDHTFHYTARGKPETGRIVADEGIYFPTLDKVVFQGHVHLISGDGFELFTDQLVYDKGVASSEYPLRFARKDLSGEARGLHYEADAGRLELASDVVVRLADPDDPPAEIRADRAELARNESVVRFFGSVKTVQGGEALRAERLDLEFADDQSLRRARAVGEVDLVTSAGASSGSAMAAGGGARHLTAGKLDLWYRPNRVLASATAGPQADLTIEPGPKDPPERRRVQADFLFFSFDEQGRLTNLRAEKARDERDSRVDVLPLAGHTAPARSLKCRNFNAAIDPESGEARNIEFNKDVEFVHGAQRATADRGDYAGDGKLLTLREEPLLIDEEAGTRLSGGALYFNVVTGDVMAGGEVRQVLLSRPGTAAGLLSGAEPVLLTCRAFEYDARDRTGRYREEALLRSGKDEVRAPQLLLRETSGGRTLEANGGVVSRLHPQGQPGAGHTPPPVEARAREMLYQEAARRIRYRGEVAIRQGDIATRSPEATLTLSGDGSGIAQLVAGEPVEVLQGKRRAQGARATYTPDDERLVLVGERVTLQDERQRLEGRTLTFYVGDERILVDGQERVRTQTVIRREPPRH